MKYTGAEIIIKLLERQGIDIITGIPGGSNLPLYNALYKSKIRHILARHEQGAGFISHGMARSTGRAAVCFATSGPGLTNLLTAIADAKLDSIPIVAIVGQVSSGLIGTDAFQEVDTYGLTIPITKHNVLIRTARELLDVIPEAFRIAGSGRPGPVVIDVPKDVQLEEVEIDSWPDQEKSYDTQAIKASDIQKAAKMINESKRPLLYVGGGIIHANAQHLLYQLAKKNTIPVTSTLMGLGCFPFDDRLYLGMLGMHGARYTNMIVNEADLILAFGVRFDDRATGNVAKFCPNAAILHIDIDPSEINKIKRANFHITADVGLSLKELIPFINTDSRMDWISCIERIKEEYPFVMPKPDNTFHPVNFIRSIGSLTSPDTIITTDVGQHQMWVAQVYPFRYPRTLLTSGGLGTMGFGLPAAIGAALANPDRRVVCFSGDGSLLMNIQELATLAELKLNVTVFVMNNKHLGLVRQQQKLFYGKNYIASAFTANPDFVAITRGFGIRSYDLEAVEEPMDIVAKVLSEPGPCLINVPVSPDENVMPMVPPGAANHEAIDGSLDG
ncbi:MAG: biosynthetic-type acetolactate synthase large subunit [Clostridia bacterium]|nr:biosynthetic-type acetolactate synthase large subunit [Clostridia bacterium]